MTDVIVRPEGPLARGSDRRASITVRPGGSAANQAAWLAFYGVSVDFVARVGSDDVQSETARFKAIGVTPHLAAIRSTRPGGLSRSSTPTASAASSPIAAPTKRSRPPTFPTADRRRCAHPSLRLFVLRSLAARGGSRCDAARGGQAHQRRSGVGGIPARGRGGRVSRVDARRVDPVPQRRGSGVLAGSDDPETQCARLANYPLVVVKRGAAGAEAAEGARRWRIRRRGSRRSTRPARATPSSPLFLPSG